MGPGDAGLLDVSITHMCRAPPAHWSPARVAAATPSSVRARSSWAKATSQLEIGAEGQGLKVLLSRDVYLPRRRQQEAEVRVADGVSGEAGKKGNASLVRPAARVSPRLVVSRALSGANRNAVLKHRSASVHRPCK